LPLKVEVDKPRLAALCRQWNIIELSVFGSAVREDFSARSDIDVLIKFAPGCGVNFDNRADLIDELSAFFERKADVIDLNILLKSDNYIRRNHILKNLVTVYVA
jgi:predicted nucleotidyltransferase